MAAGSPKKIAIFGHYGNKNLGDEAIIEAMLKQMRRRLPDAELVGMSIDPMDTARRHQVESFAIRHRQDRQHGPFTPEQADRFQATGNSIKQKPPNYHLPADHHPGWKQRLKQVPLLGKMLRLAQQNLQSLQTIKNEVVFLIAAKRYLDSVDLLIVTGSNQFLDNFGGAWGFPYTLLKWSLLARVCNTQVAYASVGAGPLTLPLSYAMLCIALKSSAFLSYRDDGSKALLETRIKDIDGHIYPDIAHSLDYYANHSDTAPDNSRLTIAINPMPVYDSRYWAVPDESKYQGYVQKISELCAYGLRQGYQIKLFSTQTSDAAVINDVLDRLQQEADFTLWQSRLLVVNDDTVSSLMATIASADVVVATRFHATVLPLQLNKPVLGICYYRKAAELLDDVGLSQYHVDIDDFDSVILINKLQQLIAQREALKQPLAEHYKKYSEALAVQYQQLAALLDRPA